MLADLVKMPEDRQSTCRGDYSNASWSWETVLKPHRRAPDQAKTQIMVKYDKAEGNLAAFETALRDVHLLETIASQSAGLFTWRRPFELEAQACGQPGAAWDVATHRLTFCYELAAEFAQLYRQYGEQMDLPRFPSPPDE